jgi:hypothetical protein
MPTKPATKKSIVSKTKAIKPVEQNTAVKKAAPDKGEKAAPDKGDGLRVLKQVLHLSPSRKKAGPDKVEHLVRDYLAKLREADLTFENGTAVVEKYRSKYPELSNHIRRIVPEERLIELTQNQGTMPTCAGVCSSFASWMTMPCTKSRSPEKKSMRR